MHVTPDDEWVSRGTALQLLLESLSTSPPASLAPGEARVVDELHALWTVSDRALADAANYYIYEASPGGPPDPASLAARWGPDPRGITMTIVGRFPWLLSALRPGMLWESTAYPLDP